MSEKAAPANNPEVALLEPQTQRFVDAIAGGSMMHERSSEDGRRFLMDAQSGNISSQPYVLKYRGPTGPTGAVPIRIVRTESTPNPAARVKSRDFMSPADRRTGLHR